MTPQEFAAKWRGVTLKERSAAQEHFIDLCRMLGHATPAEADPEGAFFTFEKGVEKLDGGQGFADVWYRGHFAWEYKTRHRDLNDAYRQLVMYRDNLENPPLLVVCDIERFEVHTNFTNTVKEVHRFTNDEIADPKNLAILRALFNAPESLKPSKTLDQVTEEAAADFARLAPMLTARGIEPHDAAHFLIRVLFCLFAEGVGLLKEKPFTRLVGHALRDSSMFPPMVRGLFGAMAVGGPFGAEVLPYFNGGLFRDIKVVELTADELKVLHAAARHDWASVEPAIFGTLFERSLDPSKRSQLGAHYTSRQDILDVVEPVVMAPLRQRWAEVREQATELRARWDEVLIRERGHRDAQSERARNKAESDLRQCLTQFLDELSAVTVLDPACGSGNFLYVTLALLMDLQNEVRTWTANNRVGGFLPAISPQQLYGFEVNAYATELAQVVIWIGYLQWMIAHYGSFDDRPILKAMNTIVERDAVIGFSEDGKPFEPEWPAVYAIVGNPPFIGGKKLRTELEAEYGGSYVDDLFRLYEGRVPHEADYVCYWVARARQMVAAGKAQRVGLVTTNSIRGGANREVLKRIKETGDIFMAWSDRDWTLDGAAVRISLIGFDGGHEAARVLDGKPVATINPDLTASVDLTRARRLAENLGIAFMGDTKGGAFDIPGDLARAMLALPLNPNGRPNADVVKPWANGLDITRRPRGMYIVDFGADMPLDQAALYERPFTHVEEQVKPERMTNRRAAYRERWWLHMEPRPAMRVALSPLARYIATPTVAKHRLFVCLPSVVVPDHQLIVIARDDDYTFGVLHSRLHEVWSLRMGTSLEDRPRYTPTTTFETFPFPHPNPAQREAIAEAARDLDTKRSAWLNPTGASEDELKRRTLTNLYNERPAWLRMAHERLDAAVFAAYGWDPAMDDEEMLGRLLTLNLERGAAGAAVSAVVGSNADEED